MRRGEERERWTFRLGEVRGADERIECGSEKQTDTCLSQGRGDVVDCIHLLFVVDCQFLVDRKRVSECICVASVCFVLLVKIFIFSWQFHLT